MPGPKRPHPRFEEIAVQGRDWPDSWGLVPRGRRSLLDADPGLARLLRVLRESGPAHSPDLAGAAAIAGRSVASLERDFHAATGFSCLAFCRAWRLETARVLLRRPGARVKAVRLVCGFRSTAHFCKAYRRFFGEAPREAVRRRRRGPVRS